MVDWSSPSQLAKDSDSFSKLVCALFGVYVWEIFQTSSFEWSLLTGRRKFSWPLVLFFFLCRYCLLFALIGILISMAMTERINCQALYTFNSWAGNMAILCASTSLMLRTIAIWERQLKIAIPLMILCLAHWALLWRGMFVVNASYSPTSSSCVVTSTDHVFLNITFFMTMGFDLIILLFTMLALIPLRRDSGLWNLLFQDGLVYFIIAFFCNALPAIFNVIDLNVVMNIIATVPAATFSAIAACRAVIRLHEFTHTDVYVHSATQMVPKLRGNNAERSLRAQAAMFARPEVHVTMDHIIMEDFSPSADTHEAKGCDLEALGIGNKESPRRDYVMGMAV